MKPEIEILQTHAISKKGLLISTKYINNHTQLEWECENKHRWLAIWHNIKDKNQWCPTCANQTKPNIEELQKYAISKGGKLISTEYINNRTFLQWQCIKEHIWEAGWGQIKHRGDWCPECAGKRTALKDLQEYAISKDGKLISTEYIKAKTLMKWECKNKHIWHSNWDNIKNKSHWCPKCKILKTEKVVKQLLENTLNIPFEKMRFYYDKLDKKKYYELDGYNEEHKIAFEYNGEQHYKYFKHWHKTKQTFLDLQQRDKDKEQFCIDNNIKLIIIPYTEKNKLETYLQNCINIYNINKYNSLST